MTNASPATSIFTDNALQILCKRYFNKTVTNLYENYPQCPHCEQYHETEDEFIRRVALRNPRYEHLVRNLWFLPNSPTLFNVHTKADGSNGGSLSACFFTRIEDTMESILAAHAEGARVLKAGGGMGYDLSPIRAQGSPVNSTHGVALGPLGVLRMLHVMAREVTQGGKRDGAQMGILHCEHEDVEKFIHVKDTDPDGLSTFNISVAITDDFMETALRDTDSKQHRLLREMAESAWKTGDPGVFFIDAANRRNPTPWRGRLTGTNPCGEVPLLPDEPCNLGSINLGRVLLHGVNATMADWGELNWKLLDEVATIATEYLDDILDINTFPQENIRAAAMDTRKLGLGACGFADLLAVLGIEYGSAEAEALAEQIQRTIDDAAARESLRLGQVKGPYPAWEDGPEETRGPAYRNATRTCIAPTGSIAIFMDASSGIEPYPLLQWTRKVGQGDKQFEVVEKPWPLRDGALYANLKTAQEVDLAGHVRMQAAFQRHTNLAVSKTINLPNSATPDDVFDAYVLMWQQDLTGGTIYRDGSRTGQVLSEVRLIEETIDEVAETLKEMAAAGERLPVLAFEQASEVVRSTSWRDKMPAKTATDRYKIEIGDYEGYAFIGRFPDGVPGEVFLQLSHQGSMVEGFGDWAAQSISYNLQMLHMLRKPHTLLTEKWRGRQFEPSGMTNIEGKRTASSIADLMAHLLDQYPTITQVEQQAAPTDRYEAWPGTPLTPAESYVAQVADSRIARELRHQRPVAPIAGGSHHEPSGAGCPTCGAAMWFVEGCQKCMGCGYSKC